MAEKYAEKCSTTELADALARDDLDFVILLYAHPDAHRAGHGCRQARSGRDTALRQLGSRGSRGEELQETGLTLHVTWSTTPAALILRTSMCTTSRDLDVYENVQLEWEFTADLGPAITAEIFQLKAIHLIILVLVALRPLDQRRHT